MNMIHLPKYSKAKAAVQLRLSYPHPLPYQSQHACSRSFSTGTRNYINTDADADNVKSRLRALLRESAQPVAVVTARVEKEKEKRESKSESGQRHRHRYHGATLSSFTSIALDPFPLVAFSLRIPSRMAVCLGGRFVERERRLGEGLASEKADMVINLLSEAQASEAVIFSRADLFPDPFGTSTSPSTLPSDPLSGSGSPSKVGVKYTLTPHDIPILENSLGSISCQLVAPPIPLHDLGFLGRGGVGCRDTEGVFELELKPGPSPLPSVTSELFIARVLSVERLALEDVVCKDGEDGEDRDLDPDPRMVPLLYRRRGYVGCS